MNRQMKRAQERAERQQRRGGAPGGPGGGPPAGAPGQPGAPKTRPTTGRKRRAGVRQFLREVRQELQKVNWPTRRELVTYTVVVLVTVTVLATYVFGLDFVFSKAIFSVLGK